MFSNELIQCSIHILSFLDKFSLLISKIFKSLLCNEDSLRPMILAFPSNKLFPSLCCEMAQSALLVYEAGSVNLSAEVS